MVKEVDCSEQQLDLFEICGVPVEEDTRDSSFGKMCREPSRRIEDGIFMRCYKKSERPKFQFLLMPDGRSRDWWNCRSVISHGEHLTLNIGASPKDAEESFLSQILQPSEDVPEKYYLSGKACRGILRRAEKRGKELPPELKAALEAQAGIA